MIVFTIIGLVAYYLLYAVEIAMLFRAIFSWFDPMMNSVFHRFAYAVTEPIISPVRKLMRKLNLNTSLPIDLSFTVTVVLIIILQRLIIILI